jgi:uncharacterized membrane protein
MKIFSVLFCIGLLLSCGKIANSSSDDNTQYAPPVLATGAFGDVQAMLIQHCTFCHSAWNQYTAQDFISNGLVVPGSIISSKLYFRNRNSTVDGAGAKDMPNTSPAISPANLVIMENWINTL